MDVSSILWSSNKLNHMKINVKHLKLPNIITFVPVFLMVNISVLGICSELTVALFQSQMPPRMRRLSSTLVTRAGWRGGGVSHSLCVPN
jgi:hypothetical protein